VPFLVITIDKLRFAPYRAASDLYLQRLRHYQVTQERELKPARGKHSDEQVRQLESDAILAAHVGPGPLVVLDERGDGVGSLALAQRLDQWCQRGQAVSFAVGGALGHAGSLRERADWLWSLSPLTLPHELARVLLYEQLYRAMTILRGEPYHK